MRMGIATRGHGAGHIVDSLSVRELEVLRFVAHGAPNKKIATQLQITEETVKDHVKRIRAKLAANNRTHAVTIALCRGIIELPRLLSAEAV